MKIQSPYYGLQGPTNLALHLSSPPTLPAFFLSHHSRGLPSPSSAQGPSLPQVLQEGGQGTGLESSRPGLILHLLLTGYVTWSGLPHPSGLQFLICQTGLTPAEQGSSSWKAVWLRLLSQGVPNVKQILSVIALLPYRGLCAAMVSTNGGNKSQLIKLSRLWNTLQMSGIKLLIDLALSRWSPSLYQTWQHASHH